MLDWRVRVEGDNISFSDDLIFKNRSDKSVQGMSPKEAFEFTRVTGVPADSGNRRIKAYAKVTSQITAKSSILAYGPILIALPCYSESDRFWDKTSTLLGGHAVSLVGWEANTFILRNSWGPSYGRGGYSFFDYDDFAKILESWVIIS
jgi:C1A family cysteine protease